MFHRKWSFVSRIKKEGNLHLNSDRLLSSGADIGMGMQIKKVDTRNVYIDTSLV